MSFHFQFGIAITVVVIGLRSGLPLAGEHGLKADFTECEIGGIPKGWQAPDSVAIQANGERRWLQAVAEGSHKVILPPVELADFELNTALMLDAGGQFSVAFIDDQDQRISVSIDGRSAVDWGVRLQSVPMHVAVRSTDPIPVEIRRTDNRWLFSIDGKVVVARRFSKFGAATRVELTLTGPSFGSGTRIYDGVEIR